MTCVCVVWVQLAISVVRERKPITRVAQSCLNMEMVLIYMSLWLLWRNECDALADSSERGARSNDKKWSETVSAYYMVQCDVILSK